ncbi:MAG: slipin family protein [Nanoarchaeota archaeon]
MVFSIYYLGGALALLLVSSIRQVNEYQRGVKFTLGKYSGIMSPGWRLVIPVFQSYQKIDLRVKTVDVPGQDCVSKDNISLKVNAVLYYKVNKPDKAVLEVEDFDFAVSQLAQTTMRNIIGEFELDDILSKRETINTKIQSIVDKETDVWGIKVTNIEVKDIELPENMKRALAAQAEAERDRRAKITSASGEKEAAKSFLEAAQLMSKNPSTLQLRLLHTLQEISAEKNSTIILPIPIELMEFFGNRKK